MKICGKIERSPRDEGVRGREEEPRKNARWLTGEVRFVGKDKKGKRKPIFLTVLWEKEKKSGKRKRG